MCDTYVDTVGYVCSECQELFKQAMNQEVDGPLDDYDITASLDAWLDIERDEEVDGNIYKNIDSYFRQYKHENR